MKGSHSVPVTPSVAGCPRLQLSPVYHRYLIQRPFRRLLQAPSLSPLDGVCEAPKRTVIANKIDSDYLAAVDESMSPGTEGGERENVVATINCSVPRCCFTSRSLLSASVGLLRPVLSVGCFGGWNRSPSDECGGRLCQNCNSPSALGFYNFVIGID